MYLPKAEISKQL